MMSELSQGSHYGSPIDSQAVAQQPSAGEIPIETLIDHLLNAKKALNSIDTLWRANEIVSTAQTALEESVIISARTGFLRRGITQQVRVVEQTRNGLEEVKREGDEEFTDVVRSLDAADKQLKSTMATLSETFVASQLRPYGEEPRNLVSFIDLSSIDALHSSIKETLDSCTAAKDTFQSTLDDFDAQRQALQIAIKNAPSRHKKTENAIPAHLHELETHASEMASLLDSLTSHFDLCANAVRHTEGGYDALLNAVAGNRLPEGVRGSGLIPSPNSSINIEPISDSDRREMLDVIHGDAGEVTAVLQDLETALGEMEGILPLIMSHVEEQREGYLGTTNAFRVLEKLAQRMGGYLSAAEVYRASWSLAKGDLLAKAEELDGMDVFYSTYLNSYDQLLLEVARRREREQRMKEVLRKAMEKVERIREEDCRERGSFRNEIGQYLPADLWDGLRRDAPVWECVVYGVGSEGEIGEEQEGGEEGISTPELKRELVEDAQRRELERERGSRRASEAR